MTRDELMEIIGQPIHDMRYNCGAASTTDIAAAVLSRIEAAGLCIVPREATEVMIDAVWGDPNMGPTNVYRDMIEAGKL